MIEGRERDERDLSARIGHCTWSNGYSILPRGKESAVACRRRSEVSEAFEGYVGIGWDGMGMGWDGMGWDGMRLGGMGLIGWDEIRCMLTVGNDKSLLCG